MARDDVELADWLDRQWDRYLQALPVEPGGTDDERDTDRLAAIRRLHALDKTRVAGAARERVWQTVTTRLSQEERMNGAHPIPSANGHGPRTAYLYPPAERAEPVRSRRRWWPAVEFAAMVALVAILLGSLATGGRFIPFRPDSGSNGDDVVPLSGGSVVDMPSARGVPAEVILRRVTFAPGASWESVPGLVVVTLVESGSLTFSSAKGTTPASVVQAGFAYQSEEASVVRNDGGETAVALQGIVSYAPAIEPATDGVTAELLARHVTKAIAGGWMFVQLDRVSLAPGESIVDPVQGDTGFSLSGPAVTLAAVESGTVTLYGSGSTGVSGGVAGAEAGVVIGSGNVEARANAEPIAGTVALQPGFGTGGSGSIDGRSIDEVGDETSSGGAGTSGVMGSHDGGVQTANEEPNAGASAGGVNVETSKPDAEPEGGAKAIGDENAVIAVTGAVEPITVTPGESETISKVVPASASGVVESSGATEIRNTGSGTAVASILTLVPGVYEGTIEAPAEGGASAGGE